MIYNTRQETYDKRTQKVFDTMQNQNNKKLIRLQHQTGHQYPKKHDF